MNISYTKLSTYLACGRKGYFSYVKEIVPARNEPALVYGHAIHAGLAAHFNGADVTTAIAVAEKDAVDNGLDSMFDKRTSTAAGASVATFICDRHPFTNVQAVEKSFELPFHNHTITGVIDLIADYKGTCSVVDHKTTSIFGETFLNDKYRNAQFLLYLLAAESLGFKPKQVVINAIISRSKGIETQSCAFPVSTLKIDEFRGELYKQLGLVEFMIEQGEACTNRDSCCSKYGKCPYWTICETPYARRNELMSDVNFYIPKAKH
jgi:hypothetical protein